MKIINRTHKIRLDPTYKQATYFRKACGVARFTWNWALSKWEEKYKAGQKTNALALKKEFNALKESDLIAAYHDDLHSSSNLKQIHAAAAWVL